ELWLSPGTGWAGASPGSGGLGWGDGSSPLVVGGAPPSAERNQTAALTSIAKTRAPTAPLTIRRRGLGPRLRSGSLSGAIAERSNGRPRARQKSSRFFRLVATKGWPGSSAFVAIA